MLFTLKTALEKQRQIVSVSQPDMQSKFQNRLQKLNRETLLFFLKLKSSIILMEKHKILQKARISACFLCTTQGSFLKSPVLCCEHLEAPVAIFTKYLYKIKIRVFNFECEFYKKVLLIFH